MHFFASRDGYWDASDTPLGSGSVGALAPGRSRKVKLKARVAAAEVRGSFVLAVVGNPPDGNAAAAGPVP